VDRQFRQDLIHERTRSVSEIRRRLADTIRMRRRTRRFRLDMPPQELDEQVAEDKRLSVEIRVLRWVLNHDLSLDEFYRERYNREMPQ